MASGLINDTTSPSSSNSSSPRSSAEIKSECLSDDDSNRSIETPNTSPEMSSVSESKELISMFTNVELGVVDSLDRRDKFIVTLAEAKVSIAKAEKELARCRAKEASLLHRLQRIREEVARRRLTQADINLERAKSAQRRLDEQPRLVETPGDLVKSLFRPAASVAEEIGVV